MMPCDGFLVKLKFIIRTTFYDGINIIVNLMHQNGQYHTKFNKFKCEISCIYYQFKIYDLNTLKHLSSHFRVTTEFFKEND